MFDRDNLKKKKKKSQSFFVFFFFLKLRYGNFSCLKHPVVSTQLAVIHMHTNIMACNANAVSVADWTMDSFAKDLVANTTLP